MSEIADAIIPVFMEWQNCPLRRIYAYVYMDAAYFNVREYDRIIQKANYSTIRVNLFRQSEVLKIGTGNAERASYWVLILDSLKFRGVDAVLLFAVDGLKGLLQAIQTVYPNSLIQRCIVHQLRNCFKLVPFKDRHAVGKSMKPIYQASIHEGAELALDTSQGQ